MRGIQNEKISFAGNFQVISSIQRFLIDTININETMISYREYVSLKNEITHCCKFSFSSKKDVENFYNLIYKDATIYLTRKRDRFESLEFITPIN